MTTLFIDVSHHDWNRRGGNLDWRAIAAAGVSTVVIRASYGDPAGYHPATEHFLPMAAGARAAGLLVGGYHNLIHGDAASHERQAAWFQSELFAGGCAFGMLDVEPYEALKANGLWPRWDDVRLFRSAWYARAGWVPLSFYIARWVWADWLGKPDMTGLGGPLFNAAYPSAKRLTLPAGYQAAGGDNGSGWVRYGGLTPDVWQFTDNASVPGASPPTDGDAYRGTAAQLRELLTGGDSMRSANMQVLTRQVQAEYPGVVVYGIGDAAHKLSPSGHNEDDTPGSLAEDQDADSKREHRAIDVMIGPAFTPAQAAAFVVAMVTLPANQRRLLYVIYNRHIWRSKGGWKQETYTGDDPHTNHVHASGEADDDENTAPWILDIQRQGDDDVKTICYDGKGYAIGDGVRRRTFVKWDDVLETQAMGRDGRLQLTGNGTIYPIVNFENLGELENPGVEGLRESLDALAARLAAADNDLPTDPAVIKAAVQDGIEEYAERILSALKSTK